MAEYDRRLNNAHIKVAGLKVSQILAVAEFFRRSTGRRALELTAREIDMLGRPERGGPRMVGLDPGKPAFTDAYDD